MGNSDVIVFAFCPLLGKISGEGIIPDAYILSVSCTSSHFKQVQEQWRLSRSEVSKKAIRKKRTKEAGASSAGS